MAASRLLSTFGVCVVFVLAALPAVAQQQPSEPPARIIVTGEGSVTVPPDYAEIVAGATTRGKTVKEASDANTRLMTAVNGVLHAAGIDAKDIQTSRFAVQPVYGPHEPNVEPRISGFTVSNLVSVKVRRIGDLGDILDKLISAGATDLGNVQFLHSDASKMLDQARAAAIADARRKAELYAQAAGLRLGGVAWVTEEQAYAPSPLGASRLFSAAAPVPIAAGENTLRARVTVGFEIAH